MSSTPSSSDTPTSPSDVEVGVTVEGAESTRKEGEDVNGLNVNVNVNVTPDVPVHVNASASPEDIHSQRLNDTTLSTTNANATNAAAATDSTTVGTTSSKKEDAMSTSPKSPKPNMRTSRTNASNHTSNNNNIMPKKQECTSLSEYLHGKFQTLTNLSTSVKEKMEVVSTLNYALQGKSSLSDPTSTTTATTYATDATNADEDSVKNTIPISKKELHASALIDKYITLHPPSSTSNTSKSMPGQGLGTTTSSSSFNGAMTPNRHNMTTSTPTSKSRAKATPSKRNPFQILTSPLSSSSSRHSHGTGTTNANANADTPTIQSSKSMEEHVTGGIHIPPFSWQSNFRKGYTLLLWIRLHPPTFDTNTNSSSSSLSDKMKQKQRQQQELDPWSTPLSQEELHEPILYRFATTSNPDYAHGVQASFLYYKDSSENKSDSGSGSTTTDSNKPTNSNPNPNPNSTSQTHFQLKLQTLGKQFTSNRADYQPLLITPPFSIPHNEWVLMGVQHSFPYLKRPFVTFSINGVELHRGEVAYPSLLSGADLGGSLGGGGIGSGVGEFGGGNGVGRGMNMTGTSSGSGGSGYGGGGGSSYGADQMNDNWLLRNFQCQGMDVASVGLYKDSVPNMLQGMVYEHGPCMEEGNVVGGVLPVVPPVVQSRDAVIMGGSPVTVGRGTSSNSNASASSFLKQSSSHSSSGNASNSGGRGIGIPLATGVSLMEGMTRTGELLLQKTLSKFVWGLHASDARIMGRNVVTIGGTMGNAHASSNSEKICIRMQGGLNLGLTVDVPKIGIVQPKIHLGGGGMSGVGGTSALSPFHRKGRDASMSGGGGNDHDEVTAKIMGRATLNHATLDYLQMERQDTSLLDDGHRSIPTYQLPTLSYEERHIPNFFSTYLAVNPLSYILLAFHLALPPPGYSYSLQLEYYRDSFDHLHHLVVYHDGEYAAKLIELLATNLRLGGRMREEILQSGGIHTFTALLRRVLLRASRLGMLRSSGKNLKTPQSLKKKKGIRYWQMYASRENPDDDLCDTTSHAKSAPTYIPPLITRACCSLIDACCGPAVPDGTKGKRPPLGLNVRRTSDIALTALFAFAFDIDLWGGDYVACASILRMVVDRYCCVYPLDVCSGKHDLAFGWLLCGQITVQYLLDMIRLRFGNETIVNTKTDCSGHCGKKMDAMSSIASSYSSILYTMMKHSLSSHSKSVARCEHDIISAVAALSDCPLGSVGAHVVLTTLRNLLVYCEVIGSDSIDLSMQTATKHPSTIHTGGSSGRVVAVANTNAQEQNLKLKRVKSEIASRLVRNLLRGQFHDVIAPMLLSRTVFDGRRVMIETKSGQETMNASPNTGLSTEEKTDDELATVPSSGYADSDGVNTSDSTLEKMKEFRWQCHWRISLTLFTCVASISGPEGEISAKSTGSLLFHSGKAGSLYECLLGMSSDEQSYFSSLLIPPLPSATSAIIPGRQQNATQDIKEVQLNELRHRLRINLHTLCGMVGSLVFNGSKDRTSMEDESHNQTCMSDETASTISDLISVLTKAFRYLHYKGVNALDIHGDESRRIRKEKAMNLMILAKEAVPPLLISAMILDEPIQELCKDTTLTESIQSLGDTLETSSTDSYDLVGESTASQITTDSEMSWIEVTPFDKNVSITRTPEERLRLLRNCQDSLLHTSANLVLNAMASGGGESSTLVWRTIISTVTSFCSKERVESDGASTISESESSMTVDSNSLSNTVMCRMSALVFTEILNRYGSLDNQWTSVELCSATARLCDLVEEKNLLRFSCNHNKVEAEKVTLTLSQVHLIYSLLNVMKSGRINTGWNQMAPCSATSIDEKNENPSIISGQMLDGRSMASSKLLLPILQPCLRIMLSCIDQVRSKVTVCAGTKDDEDKPDPSKNKKSLFSTIMKELQHSVTAAIAGLEFSIARDIALSTISSLRKAIIHHKGVDDKSATILCCVLLMKVVNEMRSRYEEERRKREIAQHEAYDSPQRQKGQAPDVSSAVKSHNEAANASEVESLLIGNMLISPDENEIHQELSKDESAETSTTSRRDSIASDNDDFIIFPHDHESNEHSKSTPTKMGWSNYKGFKSALDKCIKSAPKDTEKTGNKLVDTENYCNEILSILAPYLDAWDQKQMEDADESEFIELFTEHTNISGSPSNEFSSPVAMSSIVSGSETAADSMSSYIELASSENSRLCEIQTVLFPGRRKDCVAFAEKSCWKMFMDLDASCSFADGFFEYSTADGGRDYGGRLISSPIHPQFHRAIPRHFDHSFDQPNENNNESENLDNMGEIKTLIEKGSIKIVDITKKQDSDDEMSFDEDDIDASGNVLVAKPSMNENESESDDNDDDDNDDDEDDVSELPYLGFPDRNTNLDDNEGSESRSHRDDVSSISAQNQGNDGFNSQHCFSMSSFANPPNSSAASLIGNNLRDGGLATAGGGHGTVELFYDNCLHVKAEGSRKGTLLLTATYLIFEYDETNGLLEGESLAIDEAKKRSTDDTSASVATEMLERQYEKKSALRPKSLRLNISELSHIYLRRYRLRDSALEMFFIPSGGSTTGGTGLLSALSSIFLDFGPGKEGNECRDDAAHAIMKRAPPQTVKQWPDQSRTFLQEQLRIVTIGWATGRLSNFDYLLSLNCLAGRSFNDLCQYPVMPWVLSNYTSEDIPDLHDRANYRDLTKPMGALNPTRLKDYIERFETFQDAMIPPFMYGSHYSTSAGVVLHFLVRSHPFASLHRQLQGGHFDVADRLFSSVARTWDMCTGVSAAEVKELTPEWYCNPTFLRNSNHMKLGTSQDGEVLDDVILPPWAKDCPEKFVEVLRCAMESDICSDMLPDWIDLIFGRKQQGPDAVEAHNVFFYLTYYGSVDVASIEDEDLRTSTELQIAHFGNTPMQLFFKHHVRKLPRSSSRRRQSFSDILRLYDIQSFLSSNDAPFNSEMEAQKPFQSAPLSHWVHLAAPPPGPHAPIVAVRLAGTDHCLAIDARGIFHCFRWAWKINNPDPNSEEEGDEESSDGGLATNDLFMDKGCFVAQRELHNFRSVPKLHYTPPTVKDGRKQSWEPVVLAISKSLFASRTVLLVLSDGDGKGSLCMQLVDPTKGTVKGQVLVPSIHSARISAIQMDPIGIAAGVGGVGGELAIVGSEDGTATLWRLISSQYLPLRPRLRFGGHGGARINSVAISSALNMCVTVSDHRCCFFNMGNGAMIRSFTHPTGESAGIPVMDDQNVQCSTVFAKNNAVCICLSGYVVLVCVSTYTSNDGAHLREVATLQMFSTEGVHIGSKALEPWRGVPTKVVALSDGRAVMVCSGGGVSIHLISSILPLHFVDEWRMTEDSDGDNIMSAFDVDFGPSQLRPVVSVAGCSSGAVRFHALRGISEWSEENRKGSVTEAVGNAVGNALSKPAQRIRSLVSGVKGTGSRVVGVGKEIGREAMSDVKLRGMSVSGFLFGSK